MYVPSQFNFELKIYKFTDAFMSGVIDRLCTSHIREWFEFPPDLLCDGVGQLTDWFLWAGNPYVCT